MIKKFIILFISILIASTYASISYADPSSTRIRIGLKLFRSILASDTHIKEKINDKTLSIVLIYKNNLAKAENYSEKFKNLGKGKSKGKIRNLTLKIHSLSIHQIKQLDSLSPAGIYIIEKLTNRELIPLIDYGINKQIITYSPFKNTVEQGITASLVIEARVKPYINITTLKRSNIQLKSFFIKVSKHYVSRGYDD